MTLEELCRAALSQDHGLPHGEVEAALNRGRPVAIGRCPCGEPTAYVLHDTPRVRTLLLCSECGTVRPLPRPTTGD